MGSRRCDAGGKRLCPSALQRRRKRILHSPGVQGQAAVSVHALAVSENGGMADRQTAAGHHRVPSAGRSLVNRMTPDEKQAALSGATTSNFLEIAIGESEQFRAEYATLPNIIKAKDMPWERSPDGLIKHLVNKKMQTRECCFEAHMQFLKDGERSGKHRHMWEELFFVVEGSGYDLHWDLKWDCLDAFEWEWSGEPK